MGAQRLATRLLPRRRAAAPHNLYTQHRQHLVPDPAGPAGAAAAAVPVPRPTASRRRATPTTGVDGARRQREHRVDVGPGRSASSSARSAAGPHDDKIGRPDRAPRTWSSWACDYRPQPGRRPQPEAQTIGDGSGVGVHRRQVRRGHVEARQRASTRSSSPTPTVNRSSSRPATPGSNCADSDRRAHRPVALAGVGPQHRQRR